MIYILDDRMKINYKYKDDEDDFVLSPRVARCKQKEEEYEPWWAHWDEGAVLSTKRYLSCVMNPRKKIEQEEYQVRRKEMEESMASCAVAKQVLSSLPDDIIDVILRRAGFHIPTALCFGTMKK